MEKPGILERYKPSGKASWLRVATAVYAGAAFGLFAGAVYGIIAYVDQVAYANVLFAGLLGYLSGVYLKRIIWVFHIRNIKCAAFAGIATFLCAYYSHWCFYLAIYGITRLSQVPDVFETAMQLFGNPAEALQGVKFINGLGWPAVASHAREGIIINGGFLLAVWFLEAVFIGYFCLSAPLAQVMSPYSERRGMWMNCIDLPKPVAFIENARLFREALTKEDYEILTTPLERRNVSRGRNMEKYAVVSMYPDSWEPYVNVRNVVVKTKKNKVTISASYIVKSLKVSAAASIEIKDALS